jgi:ABC-type Na+ efflux pump permease subunit
VKVRLLPPFNVWPVVQRELREGARRPVNHRLRFLSAGVGTLLLWIIVAYSDTPAAQLGSWLLAGLHSLLLGLILLIVPALAADCIAREKREGTLGLLFLTPLSAGGIVAGKALAQALRALTLWLAVLPILTIPFMTGGITWFNAFSAWSLEFCAIVLCLAAGLLASSLAQERNTAFLLAFLFAAFFVCLFSQLFLLIIIVEWRGLAFLKEGSWRGLDAGTMLVFTGLHDSQGFAGWSSLTTVSARLGQIWEGLCLASPPVVLLIFYAVARFAARRIERSWQDKVPSPRRESLIRRYCAPLSRRRFRRAMQRSLDWNPIAWLQQYSWKARLSKWGFALALLLLGWAAARFALPGDMIVTALLLTLAGIYTFVGVSGFLEEKRSGALELLLVTPISVNKLIFGRVWGLWMQFLPAGLVLACLSAPWNWSPWNWSQWPDLDFLEVARGALFLACGFLTLPVFATYFALRVKNLIVAAVLTWIALCLPALFAEAACQLFLDNDWAGLGFMAPIILLSYGAFALLACFLLRHSLSRRIYSF